MEEQRRSGGRREDERGAVISKRGSRGSGRIGGGLVACALALLSGVSPAQESAAQAQEKPEKYVLAGSTGATLLNLPDSKGHEVLRVGGETPLAVYPSPKASPFLRVAAPGGLKVWVFGKYLTPSSRPGWVEVSGSYVNMRPRPQSADSYPLGQLDRGDRLRIIQRKDPSKPLSDDWVQVYSPPDTKGYVLAAETRALPAGANAQQAWDGAVKSALAGQPEVLLPKASPPTGGAQAAKPIEAASPGDGPSSGTGIFAGLAAANSEMDMALAGDSPDYAKLHANYERLLAQRPDEPTRRLIQERIERLNLLGELARIRADHAKQNAQREEQLVDLRATVNQSQRANDPKWGRFQTRGWLERQEQSGQKVYLVRWGADTLAHLQCSSGRYNLDLYNGVEIGVQGVTVSAAKVKSGAYPMIDIDRLEVISVRMRDR
jgi:hypothetical protein